jgi:hypothetical protein
MIENTENQATPVEPVPTYEDLLIKVNELNSQLSNARDARDYNGNKLDLVREHIQTSIDNDEWTDEELDEIFWTDLAEILDLEMKKEVEILITAEWSASVKIKRGQDVDDLDISVEEPSISRFSAGELSDVYERSFDVTEA